MRLRETLDAALRDVRLAAVIHVGSRLLNPSGLTPEMRDALLRYVGATSEERARVIGELAARNLGTAEVLMDLEADYDLRMWLEIELLRQDAGS